MMRPSFRVVLAVVAALAVSMVVSADGECQLISWPCESSEDCCRGFHWVKMPLRVIDKVSMNSFIQDSSLLTDWRGSQETTYICVRSHELQTTVRHVSASHWCSMVNGTT
ncbi:uncharacterized protein HD556DRAFT_232175 [Suillus plorans]|uniref:Uncharacterized protein n=1 Tax=Suillus plorans TaxID=116603 RepID=A0A9P7A9A8_9AGAM|nr:uncharacterized protein HD556DRAFT_232175 [Suillus plorans]KAG1784483.1 hypothetical protein HD556DRAFT_232175 [Suillus plorans]